MAPCQLSAASTRGGTGVTEFGLLNEFLVCLVVGEEATLPPPPPPAGEEDLPPPPPAGEETPPHPVKGNAR